MRDRSKRKYWCIVLVLLTLVWKSINGEDPYRFFTWNVTYGDIYPLGVKQQVQLIELHTFFSTSLRLHLEAICISLTLSEYQGILINGQFPGPTIESVTNDNVIVNIINYLDEPFLISWSLLLFLATLICIFSFWF